MIDPFIQRLELYASLDDADRAALRSACVRKRSVKARRNLIHQGEAPTCAYVLLEGWAARYKDLEDGRRQITAFLLPGDLFDLNLYLLHEMDHSIAAITPITVAEIDRSELQALTADHPRIAAALGWHQLVLMAIEREWVANVGQRRAYERLGHLLVEAFLRLKWVGQTDGDCCRFPPTQTELAEATGMTTVHVNRTLQQLRAAGLVRLSGRTLCLPDLATLMEASLFSLDYFHLGRSAEARLLPGGRGSGRIEKPKFDRAEIVVPSMPVLRAD